MKSEKPTARSNRVGRPLQPPFPAPKALSNDRSRTSSVAKREGTSEKVILQP
jgi:hypothetical protein